MKRILAFVLAAAMLLCCGKYDDGSIRAEMDSQAARIEALAGEIAELRQILDAIRQGDCVTGMEPIVQDGETVGITVIFKNSPSLPIMFSTSVGGIVNVEAVDGFLVFTTGSGESVRLPLMSVPVLELASESVLVFPGSTVSVGYTITGGDSGNSVQLLVEGLWQASVQDGEILLTAPDPCSDAKVVVVASSGAGLSSFGSIACSEAVFSVAKSSYSVDAGAGTLKVGVTSNIGVFDAEISAGADWLRTEGISEDEVSLSFDANTGAERSATVTLKNASYQAEVSFTVVQEDGGSFVYRPVDSSANVVEGECILSYHREADGKVFFISASEALTANPAAVEADAAGVVFSGSEITEVNSSYVWKVAASEEYWTFAGSGSLYLIGCNKNQGVAVLSGLDGKYKNDSAYARTWYFADDSGHGMQMMVTESPARKMAVPSDADQWRLLPELLGKVVLYYKTRI